MNAKELLLIMLLVATTAPLLADNLSVKDYADKYFDEFNTWQSDMPVYHIAQGVPAAMQSEVLDEIFNRACFTQPKKQGIAIHQVLSYIENCCPDFVPSTRFLINLKALAKDSNYTTRRDVFRFMRQVKTSFDQQIVIAALSDPKEEVRGAALNALRGQPSAEAAFKKFIQDHQNDSNYRTSVLDAKSGLGAIHEQKSH